MKYYLGMKLQLTDSYKNYIKQIKSLYLEAFPKEERRTFDQLKNLLEKDLAQIKVILYKKDFAGFFILLENEKARLIDYFAIKKDLRGKSIGSKALSLLNDGIPMIIEIEPVDEKSPNNIQRKKRKSFYQRLGFKSKEVLIEWYDTCFELMSLNDSKSAKNYFNLLDQIFTKEERMKHIRLGSYSI